MASSLFKSDQSSNANARTSGPITSNFLINVGWMLYETRQPLTCLFATSNFLKGRYKKHKYFLGIILKKITPPPLGTLMSALTDQPRRMIDRWSRISTVIGGAVRNDGLAQICVQKLQILAGGNLYLIL